MKADEIFRLLQERAFRFGDRNPQEISDLISRLRKEHENEVAAGLLKVFTHGSPPPTNSVAQELAGNLLLGLRPAVDCDLKQLVRASVERYELSVEQLPIYLASIFGRERLAATLDELEVDLQSDPAQQAIKTMKYWIHGLPPDDDRYPTDRFRKPATSGMGRQGPEGGTEQPVPRYRKIAACGQKRPPSTSVRYSKAAARHRHGRNLGLGKPTRPQVVSNVI
jgi:hypothetical protein